MAGQGFSYVAEDGFISFLTELEKGAWGNIDISTITTNATSSFKASCAARWKLRLLQSCTVVASTKKSAGRTAKHIDDELWDPLQKRLDSETGVFLNRPDPTTQTAAALIRENFLIGNGRGQTKLAHDKEVDHGRKQVRLSHEEFKDEIALLGLKQLISDIKDATEELAEALGIGATDLNTAANRQQKQKQCNVE